MLRINRNNGRVGADGIFRTWAEIEDLYAEKYERKITKRLDSVITKSTGKHAGFLCFCRANVRKWLLAKPEELEKAKLEIDDMVRGWTAGEKDAVLQKIKKAYNYTSNRPVVLGNWLNVKTCPYCNMQYTLYVEKKNKGAAIFQFDHYIPQGAYPMFSMSLYNLIPSCGACNNGKGEENWSLTYHPYQTAIGEKMSFRVRNLLPLLVAREGEIEIDTVNSGDCDWQKYDAATHVEALYKRHADVAREVFGRAYAYDYYKMYPIPGLSGDKEFAERVLKGFYPKTEDIEKRPLTKFEQDIWRQAEKLYDGLTPMIEKE